MRIRLETKSTEEILELVTEQLEATIAEHKKMDAAAATVQAGFKDSKAANKDVATTERPVKRSPSFFVEGMHLTLDITSNSHEPGEELVLSVRLSKSY